MGLFTNLTSLLLDWSTKDIRNTISSFGNVVVPIISEGALCTGLDLIDKLDKSLREHEKKKLEEFKKKIVEKKYVDAWVTLNAKKFPNGLDSYLSDKLINLTNEQFTRVIKGGIRNPNKMIVVSLLLGVLGIDRFMIGEIKMGFIKLFTLGGCGILWIIDIFCIYKKTKDYNLKRFDNLIMKYNNH